MTLEETEGSGVDQGEERREERGERREERGGRREEGRGEERKSSRIEETKEENKGEEKEEKEREKGRGEERREKERENKKLIRKEKSGVEENKDFSGEQGHFSVLSESGYSLDSQSFIELVLLLFYKQFCHPITSRF